MYFNSKPSVEDCLNECQKITEMANLYLPLCNQIFRDYQSKISRYEYCVGGECIHRGYYCPDIISDIVIGSLNRGRLYKNIVPHNPTYIYGFDKNGNLLTIQKTDENGYCEYEIIIPDNQKEIGITFSVFEGQTEITSISVCEYKEDRIVSYSNFLINSFDNNRVSEFKIHNYEYSDSHMFVHCCSFMNSLGTPDDLINNNEIKSALDDFFNSLSLSADCIKFNSPTLYCEVYDFKITDGYLDSYTVRDIEDGDTVDNTVYKVNLQRKV